MMCDWLLVVVCWSSGSSCDFGADHFPSVGVEAGMTVELLLPLGACGVFLRFRLISL